MYRLTGLLVLAALLGWLAPAAALADEGDIRKRLKAALPDMPVKTIVRSPLDGFYLITLKDGQMLYASEDGRHLFNGSLFRLMPTGVLDLTEQVRSENRRKLLQGIPREDMVVFSARGRTNAVLTVFTDIDCAYCRKLHQEVPELNQLGVEVRYLAFPRAGTGSESYDKIVSAWCADNPQVALTRAKLGKQIPDRTCRNPVASHLALGGQAGISGTPALVLQSGQLISGYIPANELARALGLN